MGEDHVTFTINPGGHGSHVQNLSLDTTGKWTMGEFSGSLDFSVDAWHNVALHIDEHWQAAYVDGVLLGNMSQSATGLSVQAKCIDSVFPRLNMPFPHNLTGKRALGLSAGPESAKTEELCMQACCDAGYGCQIYQFTDKIAKEPQCWMGQSDSFEDD